MSKIRFTSDHEYVRSEGGKGKIGISDYAQSQLGDIVFVELPEVGASFKKGDEFAIVESVKAASEIYAPVDMTITAVNVGLEGAPDLVNSSAMDEGWLVEASFDEASIDELMDDAAYAETID